MKFGVREIADVVFKALSDTTIGNTTFKKGQPVLYIDTATTSTIEGASTAVYAQGGKGNPRLITWEGEKTLTFTVEDALLSPIGFSILSGAGLFGGKGIESQKKVHVHMTSETTLGTDGVIDLSSVLKSHEEDGQKVYDEQICTGAPIFVVKAEEDGSIYGEPMTNFTVDATTGQKMTTTDKIEKVTKVFVDYYITKPESAVSELSIDAANFAGSYYVEASTLFRRQSDGKDMPAEITFPNVKIQSNFTFNMASTGDPSTFTFTMDAMPGYTWFNKTDKVLCVIQIVDDTTRGTKTGPYMYHDEIKSSDADNPIEDDSKAKTTSGDSNGEDTP